MVKAIYFQLVPSVKLFWQQSKLFKEKLWALPEPSLEHVSPPGYTLLSSLKNATVSWPMWDAVKKCVNRVRIASHLLSICLQEIFLILFTPNRANVEVRSGKLPAELSAEEHQNQIIYFPSDSFSKIKRNKIQHHAIESWAK